MGGQHGGSYAKCAKIKHARRIGECGEAHQRSDAEEPNSPSHSYNVRGSGKAARRHEPYVTQSGRKLHEEMMKTYRRRREELLNIPAKVQHSQHTLMW